jgi:hypothetical protein
VESIFCWPRRQLADFFPRLPCLDVLCFFPAFEAAEESLCTDLLDDAAGPRANAHPAVAVSKMAVATKWRLENRTAP